MELATRDRDGNTPLHRAAARGDPETIAPLVGRQTDLYAVNNGGQTPLLVSMADDNSYDVSRILLEHGSNVQVRDKNGNRVLQFAVRQEPKN